MNKLGDKLSESKCALVYGQMNEPPGARARVALTGLTVAEYFRDQMGQDVLFFVDNIFRFTQVPASGTLRLVSDCFTEFGVQLNPITAKPRFRKLEP